MGLLKGKVIVITGASRGIGRSIALKCAKDGAKIVIAAKTTEAHPTLPGTIYSVADEVEQLGGKAFPVPLDVRDDSQIEQLFEQVAEQVGKIDILVNNASAISLTPTLSTSMKKFDLMFSVNVRATFACCRAAIPHFRVGENSHILNLSPPLVMESKWFKDHLAYTLSKYGMSMCTLGLSAELKEQGIVVNSLWPKTAIATSAVEVNFPKSVLEGSRKPEIMSDAAYCIFTRNNKVKTGQFYLDETVLKEAGVTDFEQYAVNPKAALFPDLYVEF